MWSPRPALILLLLAGVGSLSHAQPTRENPPPYYIQAEQILFDSGDSNLCGGPLDEAAVTFTEDALGSLFWKGVYKGYTDDSFTEEIPRPAEDDYMGFLGELWATRWAE